MIVLHGTRKRLAISSINRRSQRFSPLSTDNDGTVEEPEEGDIEVELVNMTEALQVLEIVKLWDMQQENGQQATLQALG